MENPEILHTMTTGYYFIINHFLHKEEEEKLDCFYRVEFRSVGPHIHSTPSFSSLPA